MAEAQDRLSAALAAVTVAKRRVEGRERGLLIDVTERTAWNKRLMAAHELPEQNDEEILKNTARWHRFSTTLSTVQMGRLSSTSFYGG